ncbi:hypothetical protein P7C73_g1404, partial [Tremellales sp. Uapishka_1]
MSGLRRRSPNPNSPIDANFSPDLLSPIPNNSSNNNLNVGLGYNYADPFERYHQPSPMLPAGGHDPPTPNPYEPQSPPTPNPHPTIRLVPSSSGGSTPVETFRAVPTCRSQSNDADVRQSTISSSAASLRRHGTDPKSYPSISRGRAIDLDLLKRDSKEKRHIHSQAVPPAPTLSPSASTPGSSPLTTPGKQSKAASVRRFRNPFSSARSKAPSSPTQSVRSSLSFLSTASTLPVPFYPSLFWKSYGNGEIDSHSLEKVISGGGSEKPTHKFPVRRSTTKEAWTGWKWLLLVSVTIVRISSFGYWDKRVEDAPDLQLRTRWTHMGVAHASQDDVTMVSDSDLVICEFESLMGHRPLLTPSNDSLDMCLAAVSLLVPGRPHRCAAQLAADSRVLQPPPMAVSPVSLPGRYLDDEDRLRIQNSLHCCGFYNPFHDATYSKKCYPRTTLPGCKSKWTIFEKQSLHDFATAAFSTGPVHLLNIVIALLASNHVNRYEIKSASLRTPKELTLSQDFRKRTDPRALSFAVSFSDTSALRKADAVPRMADVRANALAILATLPPPSKPLTRHPAISQKYRSRPSSRMSMVSSTSLDTLTETPDMRRGRTGGGGYDELFREAGPRGRMLREARERSML